MKTSTKHTTEHLQQLHARLAVIDSAQKNITDLASHVTSLQNVLRQQAAPRRLRPGPHGSHHRRTGCRKGAYEFQFTLSNNSRPDCCIYMPDSAPSGDRRQVSARSDHRAARNAKTDDERKLRPRAQLRQDLGKHIDDIAEKYLIPGETQDVALMFVPSESMLCRTLRRFRRRLAEGLPRRVIIVSPSLLMLAIQVVQQIQKDARMREAADKILQRSRPHDRRRAAARATASRISTSTSATSTRTSSRSSPRPKRS